jgi:hypothetical protein
VDVQSHHPSTCYGETHENIMSFMHGGWKRSVAAGLQGCMQAERLGTLLWGAHSIVLWEQGKAPDTSLFLHMYGL